MSEVSIPLTLPLDTDGFLRRECPNCERQFKWLPSESTDNAGMGEQVDAYFCPYCYDAGGPEEWWTKEQLEYVQQLAAAEVIAPQLRRFSRDLERSNRSGSMVKFTTTSSKIPAPQALTEPDDMVRLDLPCHLEEPIKVVEDWDEEVACLICGIHYPVDIVRALPETNENA